MDSRRPPEFAIDVLADRSNVKDVVKAILHTIFFHRYFVPLTPSTQDILDLTLPYVSDSSISSLITTRLDSLPTTKPRTQLLIQFMERKRKKATGLGWFGGKSAEDEQVWENWVVDVTIVERAGRREVERSLRKAVMKVVEVGARERGHIPPITSSETNPFPFQILVGGRG